MPREILAIDASTAILLAKVDLLRMVCVGRDAWMPAAALKEATVKGTQDARMISQLTEEGLIQVAPGEDSDRLRKDFRLHEGEAQTILLARNGETFVLGSTPIWVRPMVAALAVAREGGAA